MIYDMTKNNKTLYQVITECVNSMDTSDGAVYEVFIGVYSDKYKRLDIIDPTPAMLEATFSTLDIGIPSSSKYKLRTILIGKDADAKHLGAPRMKVSRPMGSGKAGSVPKDGKGNETKYVSYSIKGENKIDAKGEEARSIDMSPEEKELYKKMAKRNAVLLKMASDPNKENKAAAAMIADEILRNIEGKGVVRDKYGHARVYRNEEDANNGGIVLYTLFLEGTE